MPLWATAYYWRGQYANAWKMVVKANGAGNASGKKFVEKLKAKMLEPKA